jgi:taurine dioxygenase
MAPVTPTIEVAPISAVMGAEICGLDLSRPLDDATFDAVCDAFHRYKLLRFPAQNLSEAQQIAFSRRVGELQVHVLDQFRHPEHPEIYVLSNVDK